VKWAAVCILALAALTAAAEDSGLEFREYHPQLDAGLYIFKLGTEARLGAGGTVADFTDLGIDDFSFALNARFSLEMNNSRYWAEYWSYSSSSRHMFTSDLTWDGDTFTTGEYATASFQLSYLGVGVDKIILDKPNFRLAAVVGINIMGVDYGLTEAGKGGEISENVPVFTVGFCSRVYFNDNLTLYFDMVGLSWTDLVGFDGGFFDPLGGYRSLDVGFMWSNGGVAALRAGFRYYSMSFDETAEEADLGFEGFYVGVDLRW